MTEKSNISNISTHRTNIKDPTGILSIAIVKDNYNANEITTTLGKTKRVHETDSFYHRVFTELQDQ